MTAKTAIPAALTAALLLAGCAGSPSGYGDMPTTSYKVGIPYEIAGRNYYPTPDPTYDRRGLASWYGPKFHGRPTASGTIYNQWHASAAHKTLPLGTIVRVTNLETGDSERLVINDRGPFVDGRIIDLSRWAAERLDVYERGTAPVRVEVVDRM